MTEKELDALIDKASIKDVRQCLKYIVSEWFVEEDYPMEPGAERVRTVNFDKELDSDSLQMVTETLHTFGFCPPEIKDPCQSCKKLGETTCGNDTTEHSCWEG